jgi:carboxypeptidase C (cathepsin A)
MGKGKPALARGARLNGWWAILLVIQVAVPVCADPPKPEVKKEPAPDTQVETNHKVAIDGAPVDFKAIAGTLTLKDDDGKPTAKMFYVAYTKTGVTDLAKRPVTFAFNGGPGSSSVWLHLGAFGPRRVQLKEDAEPAVPLPPPGKLVDNEYSLLDLTDLVFIDPVTTGYSRTVPGVDPKKFHGVQEDIQAVGEFIRLYVTRKERWSSPKFLAGESYGTTRAAGLAGHLQDRLGMNLNGIILVSSVLNFQTVRFDAGNDLPYPLFLPSYTATAWYHKKLSSELQGDLRKTLEEVEQFALGEYTIALTKGDKLPEKERAMVCRKLARYTGLSEEFVTRCKLRIEIMRFTKELLRQDERTVGRYDSRFKGIDSDAAGERHEYDPSYAVVQGPYTAMLNNYLRTELKYDTEIQYEILTNRVQPWDFGNARNRYLNVAPTLREAMTKNRDLRVFVANGYYDLATPYFATEYTFNHLGLDPALTGHVSMGYYESGHMMYIRASSHRQLRKDLVAFYATCSPKRDVQKMR